MGGGEHQALGGLTWAETQSGLRRSGQEGSVHLIAQRREVSRGRLDRAGRAEKAHPAGRPRGETREGTQQPSSTKVFCGPTMYPTVPARKLWTALLLWETPGSWERLNWGGFLEAVKEGARSNEQRRVSPIPRWASFPRVLPALRPNCIKVSTGSQKRRASQSALEGRESILERPSLAIPG